MKKLLPVLLALLGTGAGVAAGLVLMPPDAPEQAADPCAAPAKNATAPAADAPVNPGTRDYVRLNNQFVVPIVLSGRVTSLVVLSLSLEVSVGAQERVFAVEPKLRDGFLQVLFDHANSGGFEGAFTSVTTMETLRRSLQEVVASVKVV